MLAIGKPDKLPPYESGFSDATLLRLVHIVLAAASQLDDCLATDFMVQQELLDLAAQDAVFSEWLLLLTAGESKPSSDGIRDSLSDSGEARVDLESVRSIGWEDFIKAVIGLSQTSALAGLARQAASTVLRMRLLQTRFQRHLDGSRQESIYQLAYGLSHELNNPLANIAARSGLLLAGCQNHDHRSMLEAIIDNASRGSEMIGDLMLIARPPQPTLRTVNLDSLSLNCESKATHWSRLRGLTYVQEWQRGLEISTDPSMLSEVIWALLRNAMEASPSKGTIRLNAWRDQDRFTILIADEGSGLSQEAMEHCFDLYYSGREAGRGLGMGLSKARRFARILGGDVAMANQSIGGCQSSLWIPMRVDGAANLESANNAS